MTPLTLDQIRATIIDATDDMMAALLRDLNWMIEAGCEVALATPAEPERDHHEVERLARAIHLARLGPEREEPMCDNPLTRDDLASHLRWAEAILWALSMLPADPALAAALSETP